MGQRITCKNDTCKHNIGYGRCLLVNPKIDDSGYCESQENDYGKMVEGNRGVDKDRCLK